MLKKKLLVIGSLFCFLFHNNLLFASTDFQNELIDDENCNQNEINKAICCYSFIGVAALATVATLTGVGIISDTISVKPSLQPTYSPTMKTSYRAHILISH